MFGMINITSVTKEILENDDVAKQALNAGFLNFSAYARKIHKHVEFSTKKLVKERSIVVALTRVSKEIKKEEILEVPKILNLSIHASLQEVTYEKTSVNLQNLNKVYKKLQTLNLESSYFVVTQSNSQITIIADIEIIKIVKEEFKNTKPFFEVCDLAGVSVKFSLKYLQIPNVIYSFIKRLVAKKINIIEVVSTTTELTFIIKSSDVELTVSQLTKNL